MTKLDEVKADCVSGEIVAEALAIYEAILEKRVLLVPVEPTEDMWGELSRSLMMGRDMNCNKAHQMRDHLEMCGQEIPDWLDKELDGEKHLAKGDMTAMIYKAMTQAVDTEKLIEELTK